jgi:hypothetical protein
MILGRSRWTSRTGFYGGCCYEIQTGSFVVTSVMFSFAQVTEIIFAEMIHVRKGTVRLGCPSRPLRRCQRGLCRRPSTSSDFHTRTRRGFYCRCFDYFIGREKPRLESFRYFSDRCSSQKITRYSSPPSPLPISSSARCNLPRRDYRTTGHRTSRPSAFHITTRLGFYCQCFNDASAPQKTRQRFPQCPSVRKRLIDTASYPMPPMIPCSAKDWNVSGI